MVVSGDEMTLGIEGVVDCCVGRGEPLSLTQAFEALHFSLLNSARSVMRALSWPGWLFKAMHAQPPLNGNDGALGWL